MRILVTGSRDWPTDPPFDQIIGWELSRAANSRPRDEVCTVVEGACPRGVDQLAFEWAEFNRHVGVVSERHPADWARHGRGAGFIRNQEMVDLGADVCIAFSLNQSRGTGDCLNRAASHGIPRRIIDLRISDCA